MRRIYGFIILFFAFSQLALVSIPGEEIILRVGIYENPPMSFYEDDVAQGFVIDIIEAIAKEEGWQINYVSCQWSQCLEMLEAGEIDLLGPIAYSQERAERFEFNKQTYFTNWGTIYSQPRQNLDSFLDLDGVSLAVLQGDIFTTKLKSLLNQFYVQPTYIEVENYSAVLEMVDSGEAQAGLVNRLFGDLHSSDYNVTKTSIIFHPIEVRFAAPKEGNASILAAIDKYLGEWKSLDNSPYAQAIDTWLLAPRPWQIPIEMQWALAAISVGFLILIVSSFVLREMVKKRTAELTASEARNLSLLESIPDLLFRLNSDGVYLDYQARDKTLLYVSPEEFLGKHISEVFPPKDTENILNLLHSALESGEMQQHNYSLQLDGSKRHFESRYIPNKDNEILMIVRDITKRVQAEEALRQSEIHIKQILDSVQIGIVLIDAENHVIINSNPAAEKMLSASKEEIIGKVCHQFVCPAETCQCPITDLGQTIDKSEQVLIKANGEKIQVLKTATIILIDQKEHIIESFIDITERKRAEDALAEKSLYLDNILRSATKYAIVTTDLDFRITYYNPLAKDFFGYTTDDIIGKTIRELHTKENVTPERFETAIENIRTHGEYNYRMVQETENGIQYLDSRVSGIYDPTGTLTGFALFSIDVTERVQTEEMLNKLSQAVEQSANTIVITDLKGNIEYANPKFEETTGYTIEEAIGHNPNILNSGKHSNAYYRELWETITSGQEWRGKFYNKRKDGTFYWEQATIAPVYNAMGHIINFIAVKEDITERVQAEAQIKASLHEKEILLKEIHHRVKNNLAIIDSLLKFQADITPGEEAKIAFQESQNRIRSMASIHEHLYSSSNLAYINMEHYIQGLAAHLCQTYLSYDVALQTKVDGVMLDIDKAIPCGLILNELISNAFKYAFPTSYTPEKEKLIQISMHTNNKSQCQLSVSDNGVGLPPELDLENIEQKSLGLQLVKLLSEQLEGELKLNRKNGNTISLTFPISTESIIQPHYA